MNRKHRQIARGGLLLAVEAAVGVFERRIAHPEQPRPLGHRVGEGRVSPAHSLRQRDRSVVARVDYDAAQEILDPHAAVERGEHAGAAGRGAAAPPRVLRNDHGVIKAHAPLTQLMERHLRGEHFHHRCRRHRLVGALLEQDATGLRVHENRPGRDGLNGLRARGGQRGEAADKKGKQTQPTQHELILARTAGATRFAAGRGMCHANAPKGNAEPDQRRG